MYTSRGVLFLSVIFALAIIFSCFLSVFVYISLYIVDQVKFRNGSGPVGSFSDPSLACWSALSLPAIPM